MDNINTKILATLSYYDIFDFPLKAEEILRRLINFRHLDLIDGPIGIANPDYNDLRCPYNLGVKRELDRLVLDKIIDTRKGYYFLYAREYLVPLRLKREKIAKKKWRIVRRSIRWLRLVPYLRAVFASGSLAMNNTDELSDLDVLIVARKGRIWLARFLASVFLSLFGVRRRAKDLIAPDKICLNHYITDGSLHIPFKSIYTAQTYANLAPIYVSDKLLIENFKKANAWVTDYVQSWNIAENEIKIIKSAKSAKLLEHLIGFGGLDKFLNDTAKKYQFKRISDNPSTKQSGGRVVYNDDQLEFHPHSIEAKIIGEYNNRLVNLGLREFANEKDSGLTPDEQGKN